MVDCILWSGHAAPGRLLLADGPVGGDWLACMMPSTAKRGGAVGLFQRSARPGPDELAETLRQSGITTVGLWAGVTDAAEVVYNVEFVRALALSGSVATAHRVAVEQVAWEHPAAAGAAFLLPGLVNGYGKIVEELAGIHKRLDDVEAKLDRLCVTVGGRACPGAHIGAGRTSVRAHRRRTSVPYGLSVAPRARSPPGMAARRRSNRITLNAGTAHVSPSTR